MGSKNSYKKTIKFLIVNFIALVFFINNSTVVEASTSKYQFYAEKLSTINVFLGTDNGYDLEREPTRLEGLVMLVRLLGAEKEAANITHYIVKFDDVPDWGKNYVQYAYENNLTKGTSETKFGSNDKMDSKSYITFLLRALGYSDKNGDFSWNKANEFAKSIGLLNNDLYSELTNDVFLRGHVAKTSYDTLNVNTKTENIKLIDKLINNGSIEKSKAELMFSKEEITKQDSNDEKLRLTWSSDGTSLYLQWNDVGAEYYHIYEVKNVMMDEKTQMFKFKGEDRARLKNSNGGDKFVHKDEEYSLKLDNFSDDIRYFYIEAYSGGELYKTSALNPIQIIKEKSTNELKNILITKFRSITLNNKNLKLHDIAVDAYKDNNLLAVDFIITDIDSYKEAEDNNWKKVLEDLILYVQDIKNYTNYNLEFNLVFMNNFFEYPKEFEKENNAFFRDTDIDTIYVNRVGKGFGGYIVYFPLAQISVGSNQYSYIFWTEH